MRVLLSTYGSRGDVEPLVGLAVELRALGAEVRVCAPPDEDFAQLLAGVGVPMVPVGPSARALTTATPPPSSACLPRRAADLIAGQFDAVTAAAEGCDALVATGAIPAAAGARSVAEKPGIPSVSVTFQQLTLPSPHHSPLAYPGRPFPPEESDNRVLWDLDAQSINALFGEALNTNRASIGLPPVDNVRDYVIGDQPWLATGPDPGSVAGNAGPRRRTDRIVGPAGRSPTPGGVGGVPERWHTTGVRGLRQYAPARVDGRRPGGHRGDPGAGPPRTRLPGLGGPGTDGRAQEDLTPETRARARAVAGTIHTGGAAVAAKLLLDTVSRETPPVSA
ncbi:glycosyltransferase [Streptomyces sp. NPDC048309]|uniref:glycosyltransferase n=1 Tax=Streptomyces sp. NPDC048309 TaxID=3154618 RepID=UPI0033F2AF79